MEKRFGKGKMLIATPFLIDKLIRKVPKGKLVTSKQIMERLAKDFKADFTCPMTTGIFINICARAAEEDRTAGKKDITPYWRVVKTDGSLNEKFPGGVKGHAVELKAEGFKIEKSPRGQKLLVKDLEDYLQKL